MVEIVATVMLLTLAFAMPAWASYTYSAQWGGYGSGNSQFIAPGDISIDLPNSLPVSAFVADTGNDRSAWFRLSDPLDFGYFWYDWSGAGPGGSADGQFSNPGGIATIGSGTGSYPLGDVDVYVADSGNDRIQKFRYDRVNPGTGTFLTKWGSPGAGDGQFNNPQGIAVSTDGLGRVYVADSGNNRIQVFDSSGNFLYKWGSPGAGDGQFNNPQGIALRGDVYVADSGNNRIQVFDSSGNYLYKWGSPGAGDGQLNSPQGIAIDSGRGDFYVADSGNNRIQVFDPPGTFLDKIGGPGSGDGQLNNPRGIRALNTDPPEFVGGEGLLGPPGVDVYVADSGNNRIQKFSSVGPNTIIDSGPSGTITTDRATFTFRGEPAGETARILCRIDLRSFTDCTSPKTFTDLSDRTHTAAFWAEDAAGNRTASPTTRTFTVDTTVYKARIGRVKVKGPARVKRGKKATYRVKIKNTGNAKATGVRLKVKGRGVSFNTSVGKIGAGKTRTVRVKLKAGKAGKVKLTFKVTSKNAGGKTVKKKIRVKQ